MFKKTSKSMQRFGISPKKLAYRIEVDRDFIPYNEKERQLNAKIFSYKCGNLSEADNAELFELLELEIDKLSGIIKSSNKEIRNEVLNKRIEYFRKIIRSIRK